ncbi:DsbA family oxidoreductase [Halomonas sp. MA07-2]|uniref:DsbA family oxidoreductase n=1 Tax=Halomonas sp. MA07-2 TaxID=3440841 RepID=UPI003EED2C18
MTQPRIALDIFSDYVCPFCYLEMPEIDALAEHFADRVTILWRAFELRPDPEPTLDPDGDYLHDIWGRAVYPMAAERGMTLRLPRIQPRSRLAHEAAAWAEVQAARHPGAGDAMHRALFRGFFEESLDLADPQALAHLADTLSLNGSALHRALEQGDHRQAVLDDQCAARDLGIHGVPALRFRVGGENAGVLEGAQPRRQLFLAMERLLDALG